MIKDCLPYNAIILRSFYILLQVLLIFIFLTLFFFYYLAKVEKQTFKEQVNLVVDDITTGLDKVKPLPKSLKAGILGYLEVQKNDIIESSKENDDNILKRNQEIKKRSLKIVGISIVSVIIIAISLRILGHCPPHKQLLKMGLIIVCAVAVTEFVFLNVVTKKYISIDPHKVRQSIGNSIQEYIKNLPKN